MDTILGIVMEVVMEVVIIMVVLIGAILVHHLDAMVAHHAAVDATNKQKNNQEMIFTFIKNK